VKNRNFFRSTLRFGQKKPGSLSALAAVMLACVLLFPGCPYYKSAFRGKVIDAETGEPVEGAAVVASYPATRYTFCCILPTLAGTITDHVGAQETLTDGNGLFYIPPYFTVTFPVSSENSTDFAVFKPGYGKSVPSGFFDDGMETFFSKKTGDTGEIEDHDMDKGMVKVPVVFGVVKLPKAKTWKERREASSFLTNCSEKECPLLHNMLKKEDIWLYQNEGWRR
jgi:hypothetical protein